MNNDFQFPKLRSHRQRQEIIKRLRSLHPNKKALTGAPRLSYLNKWNPVDLGMALIIWGMLLPAILNQAFSLNLPHVNWDKTPLLVIFSISVSLRVSNGLYERFMLKQLIRVNHTNIEVPERNNNELLKIIEDINSWKKKIHLLLLSGIILILALWQVLEEDSPYWQHTTVPVAVFFITWLIDFSNNYQRLKQNEKELNENLDLRNRPNRSGTFA